MLDIIYEDESLIVLNKPPGVPSQPDKTGDSSMVDIAREKFNAPLHLLNRLDRPVSGLIHLTKGEASTKLFSELWISGTVHKTYLAAVLRGEFPENGKLENYLKRDGRVNKSYVCNKDTSGAKLAQLEYEVIANTDNYSILKISLITGRHHQIRVQLSAAGMPVKGDVKYGFRRSNKDRSIHVHAWKTELVHPISKKKLNFEAPLPDDPIWNTLK